MEGFAFTIVAVIIEDLIMIDSVISLLMLYFNDDKPVTGKLLERKCKESVLVEALEKGFLKEYDVDCDGYNRYVITEVGKVCRNK